MTAQIISFRDRLQAAEPADHGCVKLVKGRCPLCEIRSLAQVRAERERRQGETEQKDFAE